MYLKGCITEEAEEQQTNGVGAVAALLRKHNWATFTSKQYLLVSCARRFINCINFNLAAFLLFN
jgi:hypothetical protein